MAVKRHKGGTEPFDRLSYQEQAKSITAMLNNLKNAIKHPIEHSPRRIHTRTKCVRQAQRFQERITDIR
jgi:hypothetical protein